MSFFVRVVCRQRTSISGGGITGPINRRINPNTKSGPWAAIKGYWEICDCPGDPVYLLTVIREHRTRKVCYWRVMAELRRLRLRFGEESRGFYPRK
jgi:hypothetical protein